MKFDIKKFFRSKLFIALILLVVAAVLIFGVLPRMYSAKAEEREVVQFLVDVKLGTRITPEMLTVKTVGAYGLDNGVLSDRDAVVGKYAAMDIRRGTTLYQDMFCTEWTEVRGAIDTQLQEGDTLTAITVETGASSVGGIIRPGDIVDVLTQKEIPPEYDEYGQRLNDIEKVEMELKPELTGMLVYRVLNNSLEDISELERTYRAMVESNSDEAKDFDSSMVPAYVVLVTKTTEQSIQMANQEYDGKLHLVLHPVIGENTVVTNEPAEPTPAPTDQPVEPDPDQNDPAVNPILSQLGQP